MVSGGNANCTRSAVGLYGDGDLTLTGTMRNWADSTDWLTEGIPTPRRAYWLRAGPADHLSCAAPMPMAGPAPGGAGAGAGVRTVNVRWRGAGPRTWTSRGRPGGAGTGWPGPVRKDRTMGRGDGARAVSGRKPDGIACGGLVVNDRGSGRGNGARMISGRGPDGMPGAAGRVRSDRACGRGGGARTMSGADPAGIVPAERMIRLRDGKARPWRAIGPPCQEVSGARSLPPALVVILLRACRPPDISRLVVPVVVDPVDRQAIWPRAELMLDVLDEPRDVEPGTIDPDVAETVVMPVLVAGIRAPPDHVTPGVVQRVPAHPVLRPMRPPRQFLGFPAPAGL